MLLHFQILLLYININHATQTHKHKDTIRVCLPPRAKAVRNQQLALFCCRLARGGAVMLKQFQLFGLQIASSGGIARDSRASRRFAGERFVGGEARREARWEREVLHAFQCEERDAI